MASQTEAFEGITSKICSNVEHNKNMFCQMVKNAAYADKMLLSIELASILCV